MDYVYGFIAVAIIFVVVLVLLDYWYDALTQTSDHDRMIEQERCGHDWPELDAWDMSHAYRRMQ